MTGYITDKEMNDYISVRETPSMERSLKFCSYKNLFNNY